MIIPVHTMSFQEWVDCATMTLTAYGPIPVYSGEDWRRWVAAIKILPAFNIVADPALFEDWRDWVRAFNQVVQY